MVLLCGCILCCALTATPTPHINKRYTFEVVEIENVNSGSYGYVDGKTDGLFLGYHGEIHGETHGSEYITLVLTDTNTSTYYRFVTKTSRIKFKNNIDKGCVNISVNIIPFVNMRSSFYNEFLESILRGDDSLFILNNINNINNADVSDLNVHYSSNIMIDIILPHINKYEDK